MITGKTYYAFIMTYMYNPIFKRFIEHMEHSFLQIICITFATISMTLARIWTAFSGTRTDLFWLIRPLVTLERGSGKSLNSIISSRYKCTCTMNIYINCTYWYLTYYERLPVNMEILVSVTEYFNSHSLCS